MEMKRRGRGVDRWDVVLEGVARRASARGRRALSHAAPPEEVSGFPLISGAEEMLTCSLEKRVPSA